MRSRKACWKINIRRGGGFDARTTYLVDLLLRFCRLVGDVDVVIRRVVSLSVTLRVLARKVPPRDEQQHAGDEPARGKDCPRDVVAIEQSLSAG